MRQAPGWLLFAENRSRRSRKVPLPLRVSGQGPCGQVKARAARALIRPSPCLTSINACLRLDIFDLVSECVVMDGTVVDLDVLS